MALVLRDEFLVAFDGIDPDAKDFGLFLEVVRCVPQPARLLGATASSGDPSSADFEGTAAGGLKNDSLLTGITEQPFGIIAQ
jgi:hypothetical protein